MHFFFFFFYFDKTEADVFVKLLAVLWTVEGRDGDCCQTLQGEKSEIIQLKMRHI